MSRVIGRNQKELPKENLPYLTLIGQVEDHYLVFIGGEPGKGSAVHAVPVSVFEIESDAPVETSVDDLL